MTGALTIDALAWWVSVIELPVLTGLFWLVWRIRDEADAKLDELRAQLENRSQQLREALAAHRLEVARSYAQSADVKDLDRRLISHLLRIEAKLDATALKAEALQAANHFNK